HPPARAGMRPTRRAALWGGIRSPAGAGKGGTCMDAQGDEGSDLEGLPSACWLDLSVSVIRCTAAAESCRAVCVAAGPQVGLAGKWTRPGGGVPQGSDEGAVCIFE